MNATERDQLQQFLSALRQTRAEPKDPTADAMIREAVAGQADAPYLLVQRAMGLGLSLDAAQARLQQLQAQCAQLQSQLEAAKAQQLAQTSAPSGFLMSGAQAWGRAAEPAAVPTAFSSAVAASRPISPPHMAASAVAAQPATSAWGGGLMAQVATTAAGVVAGGLLFQGVQSLMGHNHHSPAPTSPASPLSDAAPEPLPGLVSPLVASSETADADESSWDQGDDWA